MSLFRTIDRTTCHTVSNTTASTPFLTFLCPTLFQISTRRTFHESVVNRAPRTHAPPIVQMDSLFINALTRAATCQEHRRHLSSFREPGPASAKCHRSRPKSVVPYQQRELKSTKVGGPFRLVKRFAENELKALVDYYGIRFDTEPPEDPPDNGLLIWNIGDDHVPYPVKEEVHKTYVAKIEELLEDGESSHEEIYAYYKRLPAPSVVYLKQDTIRALLHQFSVVERANQASMQRFLSILDDMKFSRIHIIRSEWTSAIYLASRFLGKVSADQVQSGLHIWRDMEKRAGVKAGAVTFNVLFDVAVKAGKYALAETLLKEMQARGLKFHRHFRVSLLYYYGVRQNGNAVRQTYQDLVAAGDVVDTVVMNSVIAALFRAGEPAAAEQVFERMKRLHARKSNPRPPSRNWRERRQLGLRLTWKGQESPHLTGAYSQDDAQEYAPIAPDSRTYGLVLRHHASTTGNIDRIQELVREMSLNSVPMEGTNFVVIMYGFISFGGVRYSSWTRDKLERVWSDFLDSVRNGAQRTWMSSMVVIVALKAFKKCTDAERTLRAWEQARQIWNPRPEETEAILKVLRRLVPEGSFFDENL